MKQKQKQWTWEWLGGGYNSCVAATKAEALQKARDMGKPTPGGGMQITLIPNEWTLRSVTPEEMTAVDRHWASAFD